MARLLPPVTIVPFFCDKLPMPAKDGVGRNDGCEFQHGLAPQGFAFDGQHTTLSVVEEETFASYLAHKDSNLGVLELDDLLLFTVHPASQDEEEKLPRLEDEIHQGDVAGGAGEASILQAAGKPKVQKVGSEQVLDRRGNPSFYARFRLGGVIWPYGTQDDCWSLRGESLPDPVDATSDPGEATVQAEGG
ncbi:MAG: hypothetical protein ACI9QL_002001 [Candidatus Omnitrophota bacterium]